MILLDTSVLVEVLRDGTGVMSQKLAAVTGTEDVFITRFTELELLQGAKDEPDWAKLSAYVAAQDVLEPSPTCWRESARIYFDLRRRGETLRGIVDCCIAQIALERDLMLVHSDRDFETIAGVRALKCRRIDRELS